MSNFQYAIRVLSDFRKQNQKQQQKQSHPLPQQQQQLLPPSAQQQQHPQQTSQQNQTKSRKRRNRKKWRKNQNTAQFSEEKLVNNNNNNNNNNSKVDNNNNKRILLKCGQTRDSFDRFCDDLFEVLLAYSTFDDRIKHECVSKQWKRCGFRTQRILVLNDQKKWAKGDDNKLDVNKLMIWLNVTDCSSYRKVFVTIETVLKKCANVREITIALHKYVFNSNLLRLIADNCHKLDTIKWKRFRFVSANDDLIYFGQKCGKNLVEIQNFRSQMCRNFPLNSLLNYCHNLVSVNHFSLNELVVQNTNHRKRDERRPNGKLIAPKLREAKHIYDCHITGLMRAFVAQYANSIRLFDTTFEEYVDGECERFLAHVSNLRNLEILRLIISGKRGVVSSLNFDTNFNAIGLNCTKLIELLVKFADDCDVATNTTILLNSMKHFTKLKRISMEFNLNYVKYYDKNIDITASLFKKCSQLTHITLTSVITDAFLASISEFLPNLKVLNITTDQSISDNSMNSLSKLIQLKSVRIANTNSDNSLITDSGVCDVISNCAQFRSFSFKPIPNITEKAINELIIAAVMRPRINFTHLFDGCNAVYSKLNIDELRDTDLPSNLILDLNPFIYEWP